ncbi:Ppx/GppA family phosphatase [Novosphingobium colocasiae]|uniref:Exopolyphosphatase n=1 Tax=Novosphingobium colocasiae TaxID=1256513 RepID=A0A918UCX5_9SPHN|nr:Ppx/GppA family phosphatase [Novosphingobium colocasiae]GGY93853.1 exopolyphosphatase [Novosphingobium colocasiae]
MIGISQSSERRAIIDIGSNTVRLVVYNGPPRAPTVVLNERVNARLGRDLARTGTLSDKAMRTALSALARFATLLRLQGVTNIECVATAAARDASNGRAFLDAVRAIGLNPRLLSGDEEARASATGVIAAFPGATGTVADLGGGSLELVGVDSGAILNNGLTLPLGTLRLSDLRASGSARLGSVLRAGLAKAGWSHGAGQTLYIVGGSWRALGLQAMRTLDWPVDDPHGFALPAETALLLARRFAKGRIGEPDPRTSTSRVASLPDAAALLVQVISQLKPSRLVFSSWGLREGLLYKQLEPAVRAQDPMLASVAGFAISSRVSAQDAVAVASWTAPACTENSRDGSLRQAAGMLALAAMSTEPNMRTEEALAWALRKRWIGLDMRGRGMMAMTVFANSGQTTPPDQLAQLASAEDLRHAVGWGLAVRLCRRLTGVTDIGLTQTTLERRDSALVLSLQEPVQALYSASVGKDHKALADWLGLETIVEVVSG